VLERLAGELKARGGAGEVRKYLQWIRASVAQSVRLIPVEQIVFLRSDEKYTLVVWEGGEALIRTPIRELAEELDPGTFAQIHRSVIVNLAPGGPGRPRLQRHRRGAVKNRREVLPVSRSYLHVFRQM
jgi:DNA-binding LytR/AlgR family response regulator